MFLKPAIEIIPSFQRKALQYTQQCRLSLKRIVLHSMANVFGYNDWFINNVDEIYLKSIIIIIYF